MELSREENIISEIKISPNGISSREVLWRGERTVNLKKNIAKDTTKTEAERGTKRQKKNEQSHGSRWDNKVQMHVIRM